MMQLKSRLLENGKVKWKTQFEKKVDCYCLYIVNGNVEPGLNT